MKRSVLLIALVAAFFLLLQVRGAADDNSIGIGCKKDVEGRILGEIMAQLLEDRGFAVRRNLSLGGTLICFEALENRAIDVYPEYSGTLAQEILKLPAPVSYAELQDLMKRRHGMDLLEPFGFQNTYAVALKRNVAEGRGLKTISDLARMKDLHFGFSHEFLDRQDGWPGLARTYGITAQPVGIAHGLAYEAIQENKLDVTDVYSTDGDIRKFDLVLLQDNKHYFPDYLAAPLARAGLANEARISLGELAGKISESQMQTLNAQVVVDGKDAALVAHEFLADQGMLRGAGQSGQNRWLTLLGYIATHLKLTLAALAAATAAAIPLGILVYRFRTVSRPVVYLVGILQTIPSLALLVFMIPLFGIGAVPAIVALFLYALLPILRNTVTALFSIDPVLRKVSVGMGLTAWQRLRYVELPLAAPTILAGIKTAAVITIGTATLAALIGAGGLGEPIVTGLESKNVGLVLEGAIPAAMLAVLTELGFEGLEKLLIPKHLLQKTE